MAQSDRDAYREAYRQRKRKKLTQMLIGQKIVKPVKDEEPLQPRPDADEHLTIHKAGEATERLIQKPRS